MESPEVMRSFLLWLGEDPASGARKYEQIRQKLILLFRYRGCHIPEELADETIDRTARAVLKPDFHFQGEPVAYVRGVARNVHLEWLRKERRLPTEPISEVDRGLPASASGTAQEEMLHACLESCLNTLAPAKKSLLIRYYGSEKRGKIDGRQLLAEELGIGLNALRIQAFRLRAALRVCVEKCNAKDEILWTETTYSK
jgi:DNA-directed RNA polymerase specialized sigma24 family protein